MSPNELTDSLPSQQVYVKYWDHVLYHRTVPGAVAPQVRETIGWLVYECPDYIVLSHDRDAGPPTLKGGDPKASGLCLLRNCVLELRRLDQLPNRPPAI